MNLIQKQVSNRRFLTSETIGLPQDWFFIASKLNNYVERSPKLHLVETSINIFLLQSPDEVEIQDMDSLICVPVTGHEIFEEEDEMELLDLDHGICWSLKESIDIGHLTEVDMLDFLEAQYGNARKFIEENDKNQLASTWMLKIFYVPESQSMCVDIQFFPEI